MTENTEKIIEFVRSKGEITSATVQQLCACHRNTASGYLKQLVDQGILVASGSTRGTLYRLKEHVIFPVADMDQGLFAKIEQHLNNQARKLVSFNKVVAMAMSADFGFTQSIEELFLASSQKIAQKKQQLNELERRRRKEKLIIDLAWASSRIEGNTYSLLETEALIRFNETSQGKTIQEAQMILNHKKALEFCREYPENFIYLTRKNVFDLHGLLISGLDVPTGIRSGLVRISNSTFIPCDNRFQLEEYLQKIIDIMNDFSVLKKVIAANLLFAFLQPFQDGNKRSSRMLGNAILIANHYLPISFSHTSKQDYIKSILYFYEKQNPEPFKQLFLKEYNQSMIEYME